MKRVATDCLLTGLRPALTILLKYNDINPATSSGLRRQFNSYIEVWHHCCNIIDILLIFLIMESYIITE